MIYGPYRCLDELPGTLSSKYRFGTVTNGNTRYNPRIIPLVFMDIQADRCRSRDPPGIHARRESGTTAVRWILTLASIHQSTVFTRIGTCSVCICRNGVGPVFNSGAPARDANSRSWLFPPCVELHARSGLVFLASLRFNSSCSRRNAER